MSFLNKYPYTDFHELNLDWVLAKLHEMGVRIDEFEAVNTITFSGAWNITTQYPAWTVVSDNNIGYISIQPVPAGIVLTNTDYWRVIVDYSAQIAGMQADIINLQNTVGDASSGLVKQTNDNTSDIATLNGTVSGHTNSINAINQKLAPGKWIFVGDSYQNYGNWYAGVIARLGLTDNTNAFYVGASGSGFTVVGNQWVNLLIAFCTGRTDLSEFKHVVFVGGLNDSTNAALASDAADLIAKVNHCISAMSIRTINAEYVMAYVGAGLSDSAYIADRGNYNRWYANSVFRDLFTQPGRRYLENTKYCLYSPKLFNADGVHPNADGAAIIVKAVSEALLSGSCSIDGHLETGYDNQYFATGHCQCFNGFANEVKNGVVRTVLRLACDQQVPSALSIDASGVDMGVIPDGCFVRNSQPIPIRLQRSSSNDFSGIQAKAQLINGHLWIYSDQLQAGPSYMTFNVPAGNRLDFTDLTFDEFVDWSL